MKQGSIVRKKANDGQPIGCYYIVNEIKRGFLYCYRLFQGEVQKDQEFLLLQNKTVEHSVLHLIISDKKAKSIIYGRQKSEVVVHQVSKRWESIVEDRPTVICFFDRFNNRRYVTYEKVMKIVNPNGLFVTIVGLNYI